MNFPWISEVTWIFENDELYNLGEWIILFLVVCMLFCIMIGRTINLLLPLLGHKICLEEVFAYETHNGRMEPKILLYHFNWNKTLLADFHSRILSMSAWGKKAWSMVLCTTLHPLFSSAVPMGYSPRQQELSIFA